jgi:hypothetical protein
MPPHRVDRIASGLKKALTVTALSSEVFHAMKHTIESNRVVEIIDEVLVESSPELKPLKDSLDLAKWEAVAIAISAIKARIKSELEAA